MLTLNPRSARSAVANAPVVHRIQIYFGQSRFNISLMLNNQTRLHMMLGADSNLCLSRTAESKVESRDPAGTLWMVA